MTDELTEAEGSIKGLLTSPVLPVVTVGESAAAVELARALLRGGIGVIEVTLRTDAALGAIERICREVPEVTVGAGTVTRPRELAAAQKAGASFAVSPGLTPALAREAETSDMPFLPGVATPSEAMAARDLGFSVLKLFPAKVVGGLALLEALAAPLPDLHFCPTGGIDQRNYRDYLALRNVICVGGSWVVPQDAVAQADWARITQLATGVTR